MELEGAFWMTTTTTVEIVAGQYAITLRPWKYQGIYCLDWRYTFLSAPREKIQTVRIQELAGPQTDISKQAGNKPNKLILTVFFGCMDLIVRIDTALQISLSIRSTRTFHSTLLSATKATFIAHGTNINRRCGLCLSLGSNILPHVLRAEYNTCYTYIIRNKRAIQHNPGRERI